MKKILSLLLVCAIILPFAACGQKDPAPETTVPPAETVTLYGEGSDANVVRGTIPPEADREKHWSIGFDLGGGEGESHE